jgi:serine/threonine-protein kinase
VRVAHFLSVPLDSPRGHPDTVAFSECGQSRAGEWFLRCPYVPDPSFATYVPTSAALPDRTLRPARRRVITPELAIEATMKVLDCLEIAHEQGILHRDVRPACLFLGEDGRVRVAGFGLLPRAHTFDLGDSAFASPECAMGLHEQLDVRADVFSVGAVLRTLLTGRHLHRETSRTEALVAAATEPVTPLAQQGSTLPEAVVHVLDKALRWDRRHRYDDARSMRDALREASRSLGTSHD